ncbi:MAG: hypothetical protein ACI9Y1_000947 [Lentisphaeria bacterium]|jgi:hypothetical protein
MSLINDALQDLDARTGSNNSISVEGFALEHSSVIRSSRLTAVLNISFASILLFSGMGMYHYGTVLFSDAPQVATDDLEAGQLLGTITSPSAIELTDDNRVAGSAEQVSVGRIAVNDEISDAQLVVNANAVNLDNTFSSHQGITPISPEYKTVVDVLKKAESALKHNRLTIPTGENALFYFSQVLELQPENSRALAGVAEVKRLYLKQLDYALKAKKVVLASSLLERLRVLNISEEKVAMYKNEFFDVSRFAEKKHKKWDPDNQINKKSTPNSTSELAEIVPANLQEPGHISIVTSDASKDFMALERAQFLSGQGQQTTGLQELKEFVSRSPFAINSTVYLVDSHINLMNFSEVEAILAALPPKHTALPYLNARLASATGSTAAAIRILESNTAADELYRSQIGFLAALYQSDQQYIKSRDLYRQLLTRYTNDATYLLGYAITSDALGEIQNAILSYRTLLRDGRQDSNIKKFMEQRIAALAPIDVAEVSQW